MLSPKDYELLLYIRDNPQNAQPDTVSTFGPAAYARLKHLSNMEAIKPRLTRHSEGGYVHTGYEVTDIGHMLIEDQQGTLQEKRRNKWEDRAWKFAPIVISVFALIIAAVSLAQALHWIDIAK